MKSVKPLIKNYMNIGSEDAVENSAFIFSLVESCNLNDIALQDYLKHLFNCIFSGKYYNKNALLPCFYNTKSLLSRLNQLILNKLGCSFVETEF